MRPFLLLASSLLSILATQGCGYSVEDKTKGGPVIVVKASYPGANAQTVAGVVAAPVEQQINGVEGMVRIESESKEDGGYLARIHFRPKTDMKLAEALVSNRVSLAHGQLPEEVRRTGVKVSCEENAPPSPLSLVITDRKELGRAVLRATVLEVIAKLEKEKAATKAEAFPGPDVPQRLVEVDRKKCAVLGVNPADVMKTLEAAGPKVKPEDIRKLMVRGTEGERVLLGAVASVTEVTGPTVVYRLNLYPAVRITATPPEGQTGAEAVATWLKLARSVCPDGMGVEILGEK